MAAADEGGCVWLGRKVSVSTSEPADTVPCFLPEQARDAGTVSPLSSAETWPLKRYGRFVSPGDPPCGAGASVSWKVLESDEESGHLILTIVVSGHFFISQRRAVQEGFSLIDAQKWLKIVRRADCLLFGSKLKPSHIIAKPPAQSCRSFPERQRSVTELAQAQGLQAIDGELCEAEGIVEHEGLQEAIVEEFGCLRIEELPLIPSSNEVPHL
ncbi:meiotic recombination protein REC114 isoform 2-T2 [Pangshura tecta]